MAEIWKRIIGYKGYEVSNMGRVRSRFGRGDEYRMLKQGYGDGRYRQVVLMKDGVPTTKRVHRLVGETFLPNPENKPQIDHIDGNPYNNAASNLRFVSCKENTRNPNTMGRMRGPRNEQRANRRKRTMAQRLERMRATNKDYTGEAFDLVYDCVRDCYILYDKKTLEVDGWIYTLDRTPETYYVEDYMKDEQIDYLGMWEDMQRYLDCCL